MASYDFTSFIIGFLLGMLALIIIMWICYYTRTFIFTYCAHQAPFCGGADYYNDPGNALGCANADINDILFLNDQRHMTYKRVPKNTTCVPTTDQVVPIDFPQYCLFEYAGGTGVVQGRSVAFGSNSYMLDRNITIQTDPNCVPIDHSIVVAGTPIIKWDPSYNC